MTKEVTFFVFSIGIVFAGIVNMNSNTQIAYAHNFAPNGLSTFLTLVHNAEVELSLAGNNFPLNVTMALDHAEDAAKLINDAYYFDEDIVDDADFARKYSEALNTRNSTIHALVFANIVDQILREYGEAFDIRYDLTNMSNMIMTNMQEGVATYPYTSDSVNNTYASVDSTNQNNISQVVNIADYQSAQKLSEKASQIFRDHLLFLPSSNATYNTTITKLEKNIAYLNYIVDSKVPAQELMMLVHGYIHPSLQFAYNLDLRQQIAKPL